MAVLLVGTMKNIVFMERLVDCPVKDVRDFVLGRTASCQAFALS